MLVTRLARYLVTFSSLSVAPVVAPHMTACASERATRLQSKREVAGSDRGTLVPIAPMSAARAAHSATLLADGRVLVAGGFTSDENAARSAEVFEPTTGRFQPLPRMLSLRHSHTATLLPSGQVLIIGGYTAGTTASPAAELFDPVTNSFRATGSLGVARAGHVAVPLRDGRVLVAGGVGLGWTFLSSAELYDPKTGRFSPTGAMTVARESHIGIALQDGRVLIVGGHRGRQSAIELFASAETYDPARGTFARVGEMTVRRHKHDAVLLPDGHVLISGGADERDNEGVYRSTELFDARTSTFSAGPAMQLPRYKHQGASVLLSNGHVLIAGGAPQAETYDPTTGRFETVGGDTRMAGQFSAVATLTSGGALITGGYGNGGGPRASAWIYRP